MIYLAISFFLFGCTAFFHVLLHRVLTNHGMKTFWTTTVFLFGFLFTFWLLFAPLALFGDNNRISSWIFIPLPLTASLSYILLSTIYIVFFASPYAGISSPSFKILALVDRYPKLTKKEILRHFSDGELVDKRLHDLVRLGSVYKQGERYFVSLQGKKIDRVVDWYRELLRWNAGG